MGKHTATRWPFRNYTVGQQVTTCVPVETYHHTTIRQTFFQPGQVATITKANVAAFRLLRCPTCQRRHPAFHLVAWPLDGQIQPTALWPCQIRPLCP